MALMVLFALSLLVYAYTPIPLHKTTLDSVLNSKGKADLVLLKLVQEHFGQLAQNQGSAIWIQRVCEKTIQYPFLASIAVGGSLDALVALYATAEHGAVRISLARERALTEGTLDELALDTMQMEKAVHLLKQDLASLVQAKSIHRLIVRIDAF